MEYLLIMYDDVWGNADDGYWVNDCHAVEKPVNIGNGTDEEIFNALIGTGIFYPEIKDNAVIIDFGERLEIEALSGYPYCGLQRIY